MVENRIDELRRRLERDPGSRLFAQLAEEHRKAGDHAEAVRVARAGLAAHPAYASARLTLGRALLESGEAGAAAAELAQVVREAPDNLLAGRFLGQALEMAGDIAGALRQYTATLKMAPGDRQLESRITALRASAAPAVGAPTAARPASGVPPPPPTGPMGAPAPPPAPVASRPAPPVPPAVVPAPAPTIRLPPPARSASPPVPSPPPPAPRVPPASSGPEPRDFAERTLMYVPPPTLNVRAEETLRQAPAPSPPARPPQPAPAVAPPVETPLGAATLPRAPAAVVAGLGETIAAEDTTLPRGRAPEGPAPLGEITPPRRPAPDVLPHVAGVEPMFAEEEAPEETLDPGAVTALSGEEPAPPAPQGPATAAPLILEAPPAEAREAAEPAAPVAAPPASSAEAPLSSSTLAELYLRQGLTERAREVYRQVLADDPGNARARAGLRDLDAAAAQAGPADARAARRAALQRTIAALESLLGALRRD